MPEDSCLYESAQRAYEASMESAGYIEAIAEDNAHYEDSHTQALAEAAHVVLVHARDLFVDYLLSQQGKLLANDIDFLAKLMRGV